MKKNILSLAAMLIASAAVFTACSSSDDSIAEQQPVNPTEPQVYTMTIQATKPDAQTRGLSLDGNTLKVKWNGDEKVLVYDAINNEQVGELTAKASDNGETTLTGTISLDEPRDLLLFINSAVTDYSNQKGVLTGTDGIEYKYDVASAHLFSKDYTIDAATKSITSESTAEFTVNPLHGQAIVKFKLNVAAKKLTIHDETGNMRQVNNVAGYGDGIVFGDITVTPDEATNELWVALCNVTSSSRLLLTAETDNGTYTYFNAVPSNNDEGNKPLEHGKFYEINVTMKYTVDLSTIGYGAQSIQNGWVVTGKLNPRVTRLDFAGGTVTLRNVDINSDGKIESSHPGIGMGGGATGLTLILEGENKVRGLGENYPGIHVKTGTNLEIKGYGSLEATSKYGAGIGCASYEKESVYKDCGNIIISGGTVTATGELSAPGIGSGRVVADTGYPSSKCGDITIKSGAKVTASSGSSEAASIGTAEGDSSGQSYCKSITIKSGAIVTAKKNNNAEAIGKGNGGSMPDNSVTIEEGANVTYN